uniref:Uncharacterized protein n=1 Tax=Steinernema glaseri TaxID=37863 RepID=A0A1I7ZTI9_9BILA
MKRSSGNCFRCSQSSWRCLRILDDLLRDDPFDFDVRLTTRLVLVGLNTVHSPSILANWNESSRCPTNLPPIVEEHATVKADLPRIIEERDLNEEREQILTFTSIEQEIRASI